VGADASKLNMVHGYGCMQFPPAAEAALLHLSSLQEVIQEALSLIKSWQQQRVIIALLQQRLQQAASRASSSARNLAAARRELQQLQAHRESSIAEAAAVSQQCAQLAAHLLQVQQDLAMAVSDKQALQTRLDEALAELASSKDAIGKLQVRRRFGCDSCRPHTLGHVEVLQNMLPNYSMATTAQDPVRG
jgi:chromosome segregation ATPase